MLDPSTETQMLSHLPLLSVTPEGNGRLLLPLLVLLTATATAAVLSRFKHKPSPQRFLQAAALCCTLLLTLGATDPAHRYEKLGHEMICTCGCGQILLECNHVGCPVSGPMIAELHGLIGGGGGVAGAVPGSVSGGAGLSNTSILDWFVSKYGATVLAAPMRGGFDNVAWITPFAVFFLATVGTAVVIRAWKLRSVPKPGAPRLDRETWISAENDALRNRIRRETEY